VNAGKSTLVNALIGQCVAPTDVSECTRVVTWYRYGTPQRLDIKLRDGSVHEMLLGPDGRLPSALGVPPSQVLEIDVWLANNTLRSMTLIDTPGLGSLNEEFSSATEELLSMDRASREATAAADALVFLLNNEVKADELAMIREFRRRGGDGGGPMASVVAVLSKADKLGAGPAWRETAEAMAKRLAETLSDDLAVVVPMAGLLAETAEGALLTETDAFHLRIMAEMDPGEVALSVLSADRFVHADSTVPPEARVRLLELLDIRGVSESIELAREGTNGAAALRRELARRSGIADLRKALGEAFRHQGEVFKLRSAIDAISKCCFVPAGDADRSTLEELYDNLERFSVEPSAHRISEMEALYLCARGDVVLPDSMLEELRAMATGRDWPERLRVDTDDPETIRGAAVAGESRWRLFAFGSATTGQSRVARVMQRSFSVAWTSCGHVDALTERSGYES
jgi:GTP-binding protein EngB required for normal cell division